MTAFSQIVDAIVAKLKAGTPVSASIQRGNTGQIPDSCANAVNVFWEASQPEEGTIAGAPVDWQTRIIVDCYARSVSQTGDVAVDPVTQAVYERIAADTTLGGLVSHVGAPGIDGEFDAASQRTGWTRLTYIIEHRTQNGLLS